MKHTHLIMWDRQTESWRQQLTGEAIVGKLVGEQLEFIPTQFSAFTNAKDAFSDAQALSQDTGFSRRCGKNLYVGYDSNPDPFLFSGKSDSRLKAIDRVVAVELNGNSVMRVKLPHLKMLVRQRFLTLI